MVDFWEDGLEQLCPHLADSPPGRRGQFTSPVFITCSYSSCKFTCGSFEVSRFCCKRFGRLSARHKLLSNRPRVGYGPSVFRGAVLVVRVSFLDRSSRPRGPSAKAPRTIRPRLRRVAKSFCFLSFTFALRLFRVCS
jgi:hypothetical protein